MQTEHELHSRRRSRNVGLGLVLVAFVALVFGLTVVKVRQGDLMEGFDHTSRVSALPIEQASTPTGEALPPAAAQEPTR